ncbi:MAG: pentapeptide repeat-containing protein [Saprospiraceae bacterium]|nr:pentapeptide repeat-containing protein [Saprospiraceae bacterium]
MNPSEENNERIKQLEIENLRLKAELEANKLANTTSAAVRKLVATSTTRVLAGKGLKNSFKQLLDELPGGNIKKDTLSEIMAQVVWRITRIGTFAILAAIAPLLIMAVQTWMLSRQNDKLDVQNSLLGRQNERLDQQINLEEGNRRSSLIFFMSNIMDKLDIELRSNKDRTLSDALIGRIVSLSQSMRPYRYLENDSLTPRQLSPERGQLLFSLVNSNLDKATYDKIYARANFNYADLREANFSEAYLRGAKLANSSFSNANFNYADLAGADLSNAWLEHATFRNTAMNGINLAGANLRESRMENITMLDGNMSNADLRQIYLEGDFSGTNLEGVKLQNASLVDVNLEGCYFQSLGWIDSLKFLEVKGLRFVREIYFPNHEARKKGFLMDSVYALRLDPKSDLGKMRTCNEAVKAIVSSNEKVRSLQQAARTSGQSLLLYAAKNPFGMEDLGIEKDSVWLYRLSANQLDLSSTVMWVQYNPNSQTVWEIFPDDANRTNPLQFDKSLLKLIGIGCE